MEIRCRQRHHRPLHPRERRSRLNPRSARSAVGGHCGSLGSGCPDAGAARPATSRRCPASWAPADASGWPSDCERPDLDLPVRRPRTGDWWGRTDNQVLRWFVDIRGPTLTTLMLGLHALGSSWFIRPVRWAAIIVLVFYRKWRILAGVLVAFMIEGLVVSLVAQAVHRPRPFVEIIGDWAGYSHPPASGGAGGHPRGDRPEPDPQGRVRRSWFVGAAALVSLLGLARMYLGVDHPSDVVIGAVLGPVIGVIAFRIIAPESVFPVSFTGAAAPTWTCPAAVGRRSVAPSRNRWASRCCPSSRSASPARGLDAAADRGRRGPAPHHLREALRAEPPSRRQPVQDRPDRALRLPGGRGALQPVRRLVEYEDYILLKLKDAGLPSPEPYGFVELTPEREYLIVTEFLPNAKEMGEVELTDEIIDDALLVVRRLWDAGLAHRDIKPANVMVRDGRVVLIDPAFATVRPSPWRQAVDLANMMIILALRSDPSTRLPASPAPVLPR